MTTLTSAGASTTKATDIIRQRVNKLNIYLVKLGLAEDCREIKVCALTKNIDNALRDYATDKTNLNVQRNMRELYAQAIEEYGIKCKTNPPVVSKL